MMLLSELSQLGVYHPQPQLSSFLESGHDANALHGAIPYRCFRIQYSMVLQLYGKRYLLCLSIFCRQAWSISINDR